MDFCLGYMLFIILLNIKIKEIIFNNRVEKQKMVDTNKEMKDYIASLERAHNSVMMKIMKQSKEADMLSLLILVLIFNKMEKK